MLGLVGESASGKTTVGDSACSATSAGAPRSPAGASPSTARTSSTWPPAALRRIRGGLISYVPQDASAALNPALRIGTQLIEILEAHGFGASDDRARGAARAR